MEASQQRLAAGVLPVVVNRSAGRRIRGLEDRISSVLRERGVAAEVRSVGP
jgi:hypothetical protein